MARFVTLETDGTIKAVSAVAVVDRLVIARDTALTTGDGKFYLQIPESIAGYTLTGIAVKLVTPSTSGLPSFALYNVTDSVDMLSTNVTVDANETHSKDATTAAVIDTTHDDVAYGDELRLDCDAAGTGAAGLYLILEFSS